ncbi:MAG TPA: molybdopterin molybdotransferase MoeA [Leptolyngbyaceae cyanobacterium M65_K2018_010]|nr:molybdopterin molybdotransferase MoeA [Leptolyngbyaceae cyanobacterium M65_K2018_010]
MVPVAEAAAQILALTSLPQGPAAIELVPLAEASGRVLATPIVSNLDMPPWDNSAMDGYAVRHADVQDARAEQPIILSVSETIPAGRWPTLSVNPGQAARIFTGSMMPAGADTVVIQEVTERQGNQVKILEPPQPRQFVRTQGSFYRAGSSLIGPGVVLGGPEMAVLAAAQCTQVAVFRQPRVAILSTGDELVSPETPLQPGQIVDSNQPALAALVQQAGGVPVPLGIIPDQPDLLAQAMQAALAQADLVLSSGGVSVGDFDYVDQILADLGATLHIRSVAVKPGKPLTVATLPRPGQPPTDSILYFGLPGNPVSALVSFWRFVEPALRKRSGLQEGWSPVLVTATTRHPLKGSGNRETYLWGYLKGIKGALEFHLAGGSHSSGNLVNLAGTNGLAVVPLGLETIPVDAPVQVMLIGRVLSE